VQECSEKNQSIIYLESFKSGRKVGGYLRNEFPPRSIAFIEIPIKKETVCYLNSLSAKSNTLDS
jgi:hypothetical protein